MRIEIELDDKLYQVVMEKEVKIGFASSFADRFIDAIHKGTERKTGRWRNKSTVNPFSTCRDRIYWRECSACKWGRDDCNTANDSPYCPNCGAKMEGAEE